MINLSSIREEKYYCLY